VICLDEMGPVSARSYPGAEPIRPAPDGTSDHAKPAGRARQEIDYGRRGKGYIYGAFRPATGEAYTREYEGRTTAGWVDFLAEVEGWVPGDAGRIYAIVDNSASSRGPYGRPLRDLPRDAPRAGCVAVLPCTPALGVRVPAQVRGVPQPDRAVVEDAAQPGAQRQAVRDVGGGNEGDRGSDGVLEQAQAPLRLGAAPKAPGAPQPRHRCNAESCLDLPDAPLRSPESTLGHQSTLG